MPDPLQLIQDIPRIRLAHLPTPLEPLPRLGELLGISSLFVKRDDCTGLGGGGNKVRKLEFQLAAARASGADCIVCGGVAQSNTARQVAAACAKLGMECHLGIMRGRGFRSEPDYETNGNLLLDRLYGATIHDVEWNEDRNAPLAAITTTLRRSGHNVYLVPYGASDALGAIGYILAVQEIVRECPDVRWIVHGSASGGTQAGLLVGLIALGHAASVIGVDVDAQPARVSRDVRRLGREVADMIGCRDRWTEDAVEVASHWSGPSYGEADPTTEEAIRLGARLEGLATDPVYSGKGLAGLIGLARGGRFRDGGPVVWIHTGGAPGIFAYPGTIARLSKIQGHS